MLSTSSLPTCATCFCNHLYAGAKSSASTQAFAQAVNSPSSTKPANTSNPILCICTNQKKHNKHFVNYSPNITSALSPSATAPPPVRLSKWSLHSFVNLNKKQANWASWATSSSTKREPLST